ncbi:MAG: hypothetical protein KC486_10085, partial [Myxococcales bacterium]|nr:hypothetical protein [Myxococcales bacterium]
GVLALTPFPSADDALVITGERRGHPFVALLRDRQRRPRHLPIDGIFAPERIAVSADGRWLAISSYDAEAPRPRPVLGRRDAFEARARALAIWDLQTMTRTPGAPLKAIEGASALAFAPDDRLVASVGFPCNGHHERLIVWSLARSELLLERPLSRLDDLRVIDGVILGAGDEALLRVDPRSGEVTTLRSCGDDGSCRIVLCG